MYHNRGDSTFAGESSEYGDFVGLDDLFTERPEVVEGMGEIYKAWVDLGIDGFRIDTVKHVNMEFWKKFSPDVMAHAKAVGNDDFFMFGEVYDARAEVMSQHDRRTAAVRSTSASRPAPSTSPRGLPPRSFATSSPATTGTRTPTRTSTRPRPSSATTTWAASP